MGGKNPQVTLHKKTMAHQARVKGKTRGSNIFFKAGNKLKLKGVYHLKT